MQPTSLAMPDAAQSLATATLCQQELGKGPDPAILAHAEDPPGSSDASTLRV